MTGEEAKGFEDKRRGLCGSGFEWIMQLRRTGAPRLHCHRRAWRYLRVTRWREVYLRYLLAPLYAAAL